MLFFQHPFSFPRSWRLTRQITVRVIADSVMVAAALLLGVIVRFLWDIDVEAPAVCISPPAGPIEQGHGQGGRTALNVDTPGL